MAHIIEQSELKWDAFSQSPEQLHSLALSLTSALTYVDVNQAVLEQVGKHFDCSTWSLLLFDESRQKLRIELIVGDDSQSLQGAWVGLDDSIIGKVFDSKKLMLFSAEGDSTPQMNSDNGAMSFRNGIFAPIAREARSMGVLALLDLPDETISTELATHLQVFADYVAVAIHNSHQLQRVRELSVTDDVTSLYNARYLQQALDQEYRRSLRSKSPISVIFLDVDYFKRVNDQYGHLVGSEILRETANILRQCLRVTDIATRYGGDEFVLILPETDLEEAVLVASRCLEAMREHTFGIRQGADCKVTASFGVATLPLHTEDKTDLVRLADQAMYLVKERNRDGVATADDLKATES